MYDKVKERKKGGGVKLRAEQKRVGRKGIKDKGYKYFAKELVWSAWFNDVKPLLSPLL